MADISQELDSLCVSLIQVAYDLMESGEELPVMLATDCEDDATLFEGDTADGCYRAACEHVGKLGSSCSLYVILYDGIVQEDESDSGSAALLFEFAERGMENAWSGYVLYRRAQDGTIEMTDPLPAGEEELLFA